MVHHRSKRIYLIPLTGLSEAIKVRVWFQRANGMEAWKELERDVRAYLLECKAQQNGRAVGLTEQMVKKVLSTINSAAFECERVGSKHEMFEDATILQYVLDLELASGDEFYYRISWNFAPSRYRDIIAFVKRYEAIVEAEMKLQQEVEAAIDTEINEQSGVWDEYSYDDCGQSEIVTFIYADRIEVRAFESGWGDRLPKKGRKYIGCQGDIRWRFPLSALEALPKGYPVIDVAKIEAEKAANG